MVTAANDAVMHNVDILCMYMHTHVCVCAHALERQRIFKLKNFILQGCFLVGKIVAHKQCTHQTNISKKETEICKVFLDHHSLILT